MKKRLAYIIAAIYAAACAAAALMGIGERITGDAAAFPFEQLGSALRRMSLSGSGGNAAAIIIYIIFCSIPLIAALIKLLRRSFRSGDILLPVMSLCMFYVTYKMINPDTVESWGGGFVSVSRTALAWSCWSILIAWLTLGFVADFGQAGKSRRNAYILLWLLSACFITAGAGLNLSELLQSMKSVQAGNTARVDSLGMSYFVLILQYINDALPNMLSAFIALKAAELVGTAARDRFSAETVGSANRFGAVCAGSLKLIVIVGLIVNLFQIWQMEDLALVSVELSIPLAEIVFVMAAMMLARILQEGKTIRDDNDLFI